VSNVRDLMARQAAWQKRRSQLSWPEKIRMAEAIRESVCRLSRRSPAAGPSQFPPTANRKAEPPRG